MYKIFETNILVNQLSTYFLHKNFQIKLFLETDAHFDDVKKILLCKPKLRNIMVLKSFMTILRND